MGKEHGEDGLKDGHHHGGILALIIIIAAVAGIARRGERIRFGHGVVLDVNKDLKVFGSYHPSRLNVNTGRLSRQMFNSLLDRIDKFVDMSGYLDQSIAGIASRS